LGVSREYTTELTKAIGRVSGIGCNVVGTFTITTTEGDPVVGPCRYVVDHCTDRTHPIVEYEQIGYTARYSAQELTSGDDRDKRAPVLAVDVAVGALVRLASHVAASACPDANVGRCATDIMAMAKSLVFIPRRVLRGMPANSTSMSTESPA
jgi:hypothetical protein